jgi:hypothetical protein
MSKHSPPMTGNDGETIHLEIERQCPTKEIYFRQKRLLPFIAPRASHRCGRGRRGALLVRLQVGFASMRSARRLWGKIRSLFRPTPDRHFRIALQHRMIGEKRMKQRFIHRLHVAAGDQRHETCETKDGDAFHEGLMSNRNALTISAKPFISRARSSPCPSLHLRA